MITAYCILLAGWCCAAPVSLPTVPDTIRLEVGSPEINGKVYEPHAARVRVRLGDDDRIVAEWTNELSVGDSAGRPIHRWITKGTQYPANGTPLNWEIYQTYDAVTLAPYGYVARSANGTVTKLRIDRKRAYGTRRLAGDTADRQVEIAIDRPGFIASASDLIPLAAGLSAGKVMTAPVWGPSMQKSELRIFTVLNRETIKVEGTDVSAWKIEERNYDDKKLVATWWMTEASPYMVYGEVPMPNGQIRRMTEVAIPRPVP